MLETLRSAVEKAVEKIVDETIAQARKMLEEKRENAEMFVHGEEFDGTEIQTECQRANKIMNCTASNSRS